MIIDPGGLLLLFDSGGLFLLPRYKGLSCMLLIFLWLWSTVASVLV